MEIYSVGTLYIPGRTQWPEATDVDVRGGELTLRLYWKDLCAQVVQMVERNPVELGLTVQDGLVFLLYRIEGATEWSDQPVSYRNIAPSDRQLPPKLQSGQFLPVQIHLVDADTGLLRAIRVFSVSSRFATAWRAAMAGDLALAPWPDYDQRIRAVYTHFKRPDELLRHSLITKIGGAVRT